MRPNLGKFVLGNSKQPKDTLGILRRCRDQRILMMKKLKKRYPDLGFRDCEMEHGNSILNSKEKKLLEATIKNREILFQAKIELSRKKLDHAKIGKLLLDHHKVLREILMLGGATGMWESEKLNWSERVQGSRSAFPQRDSTKIYYPMQIV